MGPLLAALEQIKWCNPKNHPTLVPATGLQKQEHCSLRYSGQTCGTYCTKVCKGPMTKDTSHKLNLMDNAYGCQCERKALCPQKENEMALNILFLNFPSVGTAKFPRQQECVLSIESRCVTDASDWLTHVVKIGHFPCKRRGCFSLNTSNLL